MELRVIWDGEEKGKVYLFEILFYIKSCSDEWCIALGGVVLVEINQVK